jgi:hypothetical protein
MRTSIDVHVLQALNTPGGNSSISFGGPVEAQRPMSRHSSHYPRANLLLFAVLCHDVLCQRKCGNHTMFLNRAYPRPPQLQQRRPRPAAAQGRVRGQPHRLRRRKLPPARRPGRLPAGPRLAGPARRVDDFPARRRSGLTNAGPPWEGGRFTIRVSTLMSGLPR